VPTGDGHSAFDLVWMKARWSSVSVASFLARGSIAQLKRWLVSEMNFPTFNSPSQVWDATQSDWRESLDDAISQSRF
jgi:non-ribosomal peptide synthetase component F